MKSRIVRCTLAILVTISGVTVQAQESLRIGITKTDLSQVKDRQGQAVLKFLELDFAKPNALNSLSDHLVNVYTNDPNFTVVDFRSMDLVDEELERQKSEKFIDGYIIDQGKNEGVDVILSPVYTAIDDALSVRVIDVATGEVTCTAAEPLKKGKMGIAHTRFYSSSLIQQLNERCFNLQFPVIRAEDSKKDKVKTLLVAIGRSQNLRVSQKVGIFKSVEENVGDQTFERIIEIGHGFVEEIEGDHFSIVEIKKGNDTIFKELNTGNKLFARIIGVR